MPNPYLRAALREQDGQRPKKAPAAKAKEKAAESAGPSDNTTAPKE